MKKQDFFVVVSIFVLTFTFLGYLIERERKKDVKEFESTRIAGRIRNAYATNHGFGGGFDMSLSNKQYAFTLDSGFSCNFGRTAEEGDSVFKAAYGDTLYLIKNKTGEVIKYTFRRDHQSEKVR